MSNRIPEVLTRAGCKKHNAALGVACFTINAFSKRGGGYLSAVCNQRIKRAGFNGPISEKALRKGGLKNG